MILKKTHLLAAGMLVGVALTGCTTTDEAVEKDSVVDQADADKAAAEQAAADEAAAAAEKAAAEKAAAEKAAADQAAAEKAAAEKAAAEAEAARVAAEAEAARAAAEAAAAAAAANGPIEFRINLEKGQEFSFRQSMNMNQDMDMGGMQMSTVMKMTSDYAYVVEDITEAGDMKVVVSFGRIHGSFDNPMMGSLEFDSEKEAEESGNPMIDMMATMFTANAGQSISITMQPNGEITEVTGVEALVEKLMEANPMGGMGGQVDNESVSKSMKEMIGGQLGALPKQPISVGDSWKIERAMGQMGMDVSMTIDNTLASFDAEQAVVDSTITAELSGGQMAAMLTVDEFTGTSTTTFSRNDGLVLTSTSSMNMKASMDAGAQGSGGMTMAIETSVERISADGGK